MQIKSSKKTYQERAPKLFKFEQLLTYIILQVAVIALAIFVYNNYNAWYEKVTHNFLVKKSQLIASQYHPDHFVIDLPFESQAKLESLRKNAIATGVYSPPSNPWFPGKLRYQGKVYKIKSSLKGSFPDHWINSEKISLKVKLKGNNRIKGMKNFSLVIPTARKYDTEWIYLQFAKKLGIVTPRTDFVNVTINGQNKGVYFLEETFSTAMLEYNKRKAGPIVSFDKSLYIQEAARAMKNHNRSHPLNTSAKNYKRNDTANRQLGDFQSREIEFTNINNEDLLLTEKTHQELFYEAKSKLTKLREKTIQLNEVFDIKLFANLLAIKSLLFANEFDPNDEKFYYNPVTRLFEPIASELNGDLVDGDTSGIWWTTLYSKLDFNQLQEFNSLFFDNLEFWPVFYRSLESISSQSFASNFLSKLMLKRERNLALLHQSYPKLKFARLDGLINRNKNMIRELLNPLQQVRGKIFCPENQSQAQISITNLTLLPIEIKNVSLGNKLISSEKKFLPRRKKNIPLESRDFNIKLSQPCNAIITSTENITITTSLAGIAPEVKTILEKASSGFNFQPQQQRYPSLEKLSFVTKLGNNLIIPEGNWDIKQIYQVPSNFKLSIKAGVKINLSNNGAIISKGAIELRGDPDNRIQIKSSDKSGGFFVVARTSDQSIIKNTDFDNLGIPNSLLNRFSGSITFYDSPVEISNTKITNANSEDALNIVRSKFKIEQIYLENSFSDAIDIDYSDGRIIKSTFQNIGNDALDFSTSKVTVLNTRANQIKEKVISCGEASNITIIGGILKNAAIGIASKDLSEVGVARVLMQNINSGFVALRKKPEYGYATISAKAIGFKDVKQTCIRDSKKSIINIENVSECLIDKNLRTQLYAK